MPRARSDEAEAFFVGTSRRFCKNLKSKALLQLILIIFFFLIAVYEAVQEVPYGRVTSYGRSASVYHLIGRIETTIC